MQPPELKNTDNMLHAFPVIVGATASGKSSLAMQLARHVRDTLKRDPLIVSMDSMMVFQGMDIGTAKPSKADQEEFPHACIDVVDPAEPFSVKQWLDRATDAITVAQSQTKLPIVVGGTHLYAMALINGLADSPAADESLRRELAQLEPDALREMLITVDPEAANRIHPHDTRRTIRAIEVARQSDTPLSSQQTQWAGDHTGVPGATLFAVQWETEPLNRRINARVRQMIEVGLLDEVKVIASSERGGFGPQSREALGYKQLLAHLNNKISLDDAIERIKIETRRFGKNQRTWLRKLTLQYNARTLPGDAPDEALTRLVSFITPAD